MVHNSLISRNIKDKLPLGGLSAVGAEWHDIIVRLSCHVAPRYDELCARTNLSSTISRNEPVGPIMI